MSFKILLPFYATQISNPFHNSRISAKQDKREGFWQIVKSLYPLMFLSTVDFQYNFSEYLAPYAS